MSIESGKQNTSLAVIPPAFDEKAYRHMTENTFKKVIGEYIADDLPPINDPRYASSIKQRAVLAMSAIRLGESIVLDKIHSGNLSFDVFNGIGRVRYGRSLDGSFYRHISPVSDDPFAYSDFRKEIDRTGIPEQIETDPYLDHFLVSEMLKEGLNEKTRRVHAVAAAQRLAKRTVSNQEPIIKHLPTAQGLFSDLANINPMDDVTEEFLEKAAAVTKAAEDIVKLDKLFLKPNGEIVAPHERDVSIATLIVELLANPEVINFKDIRSPETSTDRIFKVLKLIQKIQAENSYKEFIYLMGSMVNRTFLERKSELEIIFREICISPHLAIEYLQNAAFSKIKSLPGQEYVDKDTQTEDAIRDKKELNNLYNLKKPIPRFSQKERDASKQKKESSYTIMSYLVDGVPIPVYQLAKKSPSEQREILSRIFSHSPFRQNFLKYRVRINDFLSMLGLSTYNPLSETLDFKQPKETTHDLRIAGKSLLLIAQEKIDQNDTLFIDALAGIFAKDLITSYLYASDLPTSHKQFIDIANTARADFQNNTIDFKQYRNFMVTNASAIVALQYFQQSGEVVSSLEDITHRVLIDFHRLKPEDYSLVKTNAEELIKDLYQQNFGGEEEKRQKIAAIIKSSIENLEHKN